MNKPLVKTAQELANRLRGLHKAANSANAEDPNLQGVVTPPVDPAGTTGAQNMPPNAPLGAAKQTVENAAAPNPSPTGQHVPGTENANAKDDVSSPTEDLSKIAKRAAEAVRRASGAAAAPSAPATEPAPAKQAGSAPDQFDQTTLAKIAALVIATEGGVEALTPILHKAAGEAETRALLNEAVNQFSFLEVAEQQLMKEAAEQQQMEQYLAAAAAEQEQLATIYDDLVKGASHDDLVKVERLRNLIKAASELPPEESEGAMEGIAEGTAMQEDGKLPGGGEGEDLSPEQIAEVVAAAVQEGSIPPELGQAIMEQLSGGGEPDGDEAAAADTEAALQD